jgi:hypothetical protein
MTSPAMPLARRSPTASTTWPKRWLRERGHRSRYACIRRKIDRSMVEAGRRAALPQGSRVAHHGGCGRQQQLSLSRLEAAASATRRHAQPSIHVTHFPPGTRKWNKVEHRLFSFISLNWRGRPLRSYDTVINLISNTTNRGGLVVRARLDRRAYPIGKKVSAKELSELQHRASRLPR